MGNELSLRVATEADAAGCLEIYGDYVTATAVSLEYDVPSLEEFTHRIRQRAGLYPWLIAQMDGVIAGYAYASRFRERAGYEWAVETSIYVRRSSRRGGVGKRLYEALEDILKAQGVLNLNASITTCHGADEFLTRDSVVFHQKQGYEPVGEFHRCGQKFGHWYNILWMEKHIGDHREYQQKLIPFRELEPRLERYITGRPGGETAAICGLFCGTCPAYPEACGGCLSNRVAPGCDACGNGFRDCARAHGVVRCHECGEFPCPRLEEFSHKHIVNGICHHEQVIDDLSRMGEVGVETWVEEQVRAHTCADCGVLIPWFEPSCPGCRG